MAHNNMVWVEGDITGDIYFDVIHLQGKPTPYLRLYMMIDGEQGARTVKGLRVSTYGPLAELVYGHVHKGSHLGVSGHIQQRISHGDYVIEVVSEDVEFMRNIDWAKGERVRQDLIQRGLLSPADRDLDDGIISQEGDEDPLEDVDPLDLPPDDRPESDFGSVLRDE